MSTLLEQLADSYLKGGPGSGNFGHEGRPGERGGSSSEGGSVTREATERAITERNSNTYFAKRLPEKYGITKDEYENRVKDRLEGLLSSTQVAIRVPSENLSSIINDGRFKTYFETGTSQGLIVDDGPVSRSTVEKEFFSYDKNTPPSERPVYGLLYDGTNFAQGNWFGDAVVVLKDDVKDRSTFSIGDSFNLTSGAPQPFNAPSSLAGSIDILNLNSLKDVSSSEKGLGRKGYVEVQVHRGVSLNDIKEIQLPRGTNISDRDRATLKAKGIEVKEVKQTKRATKSLKAADTTKKERFDAFLERAEAEGFLDVDQIDELRDKFESGTITDDDIPLALDEAIDGDLEPEQVEESRDRLGVIILGAAIAARGVMRDQLQTEFEDKVIALASTESLPDWQADFRDSIAEYILDQSTLGRGEEADVQSAYDASLSQTSDVIQEQQAYLSRFADERAARALTDDEMSEEYIQARSSLYSGQGRAEFFKGSEEDLGDGWVVEYRAMGDTSTCEPCLEAERQGPYLPGDEDAPYPGEICEGHGYCRCERVPVYNPEMYAMLSTGD